MKPRTILLIDNDQSTRRQRSLMLLTHGYIVSSAQSVAEVQLPFATPPDLVLLRVDEPPDRFDSAFELIRRVAPDQRIGFLLDDDHTLCQLYVDGVLARPRQMIDGELIQEVEAMFDVQLTNAANAVSVGG